MRICTDNIPALFYSRYQEDGHASELALDDCTQSGGIVTLGRALQRHSLGRGDADGQSILIVNPDPGILEVYTRLLQSVWPERRVLQALSEQLALELLRCARPALVLLDPMTPNVDGFGLLDAIQLDEGLRHIPVVVLTEQMVAQRDIARLSDVIAAILIQELFTVEETLAHIKQALAGNKKLHRTTRCVAREVMDYIHEHYAEPLTRDALANFAAVSSRHLTRCFDTEVGISPIAYLNRYRIREAKCLLRRGESSIIEIARSVGFPNHAYFDVVFRREVGLAPSHYRRCHEAGDHQLL
jgi:AraC-like DNA-binding protein